MIPSIERFQRPLVHRIPRRLLIRNNGVAFRVGVEAEIAHLPNVNMILRIEGTVRQIGVVLGGLKLLHS